MRVLCLLIACVLLASCNNNPSKSEDNTKKSSSDRSTIDLDENGDYNSADFRNIEQRQVKAKIDKKNFSQNQMTGLP